MNKTRLFVAVLLFVTICLAQLVNAQIPTTAGKRGFKIEYSNVLPNTAIGKVPIQVRVTRVPAVPATRDESFNVILSDGWSIDATDSSSSSAELVLPVGKTSAEVELLIDRGDNYYSLLVERGKSHTNSRGDDLFREHIDVSSLNMNRTGNDGGTWLLISSKAPKNPTFSKAYFPRQPLGNNINAVSTGSQTFDQQFRGNNKIPGLETIFQEPLEDMLDRPNWHALQPAELPQTWVGLSAINFILISNDEFKSLTQVPAYRKIIEQWVAAGGCLVVFNAEYSLDHAGSVFPLLLGAERATPPRLWGRISTKQNKHWVAEPQIFGLEAASDLVAKNRTAISPYLNGMVAVMVTPEKLPKWWFGRRHYPEPDSITNQSTQVTDVSRGSAIPGVGKPPIALFGVFTGLFLFLIGPVILVIVTLNNNRRFLFFLVPIFSFLTCTGILGYAILADFNKQLGRTDTITALDSRSGFAYSQAYSAYYCGSQPAYYAYDTDTLIQTTVETRSGYRIRQLPEENRLSSPRIQPRKSHEVFTAKPYRTQQRFLVAESAEKPNVPEVTNLLGGRIERAFFEYQGKTYIVRDLEPKQTALGIELDFGSCRKELRQAVADRRSLGGSPLFRSASTQISTLSSRKQTRDFVAVIDVNPAIDPLIEPFEYTLQLHVVHGKY